MSICDWPTDERPREKLLSRGPGALTDAELLAIFLRTGRRGQSAVDLARELLTTSGGLRSLLESDPKDLNRHAGLGPAKTVQLKAILEMAKRHLAATLQRQGNISSAQEASSYLNAELRGKPHEVFGCLFLDNRHSLIRYEELFQGTLHNAHVYPREVIKRALYYNAAALILAHNHPAGDPDPSRADIELTRHLGRALGFVDVRLLDHLIIGDGRFASLAELGLL